MHRLVVAAAAAFVALAQPPKAEDAELVRAGRSPYELARYVESHAQINWEPLWHALAPNTFVFSCPSSYRAFAELITLVEPPQTIVAIDTCDSAQVFIRYLGSDRAGWRGSGVASAWIKAYPRRHSIERLSGKPLLRVSSQADSGSDVSSEAETWFDLTRADFYPVFQYLAQGIQDRHGFGISRRIRASASPAGEQQPEAIRLFVTVSFLGPGHLDLGSMEFAATYEGGPHQRRFELAALESTLGKPAGISKEAFVDLLDLDRGPTNEQLLVYAIAKLEAVATGDNRDAAEWVEHLLGTLKDTPEKLRLAALLKEREKK